jgi:membrane associated rhomboid family serine protease
MTPMVRGILITNVVVFVLSAFIFPQLNMYLALYPFSTEYFKPFQLFTYMFAHANVMHILFNMIGLMVFGSLLEQFWGSNKFLIFYIVTGIGAALVYGGFNYFDILGSGERISTMVGASGAVYGLLMAVAMLFPNTQVMLLFPPIPIKMKWLAIILGAMAVYSSFSQDPGDNVAHLAHLGGMVFAFVLLKIFQNNRNSFY